MLEPSVEIKGQGTKGQAGELALLLLWHILLSPFWGIWGGCRRLEKARQQLTGRCRAAGKLRVWQRENKNSYLGGLCPSLAVNHKSAPFRRALGHVLLGSKSSHLKSLLENGLEQ